MTTGLQVISASSPVVRLADWLELTAILDGDGNSSRQELATELRLNGTIDAHGIFDRAYENGSEDTHQQLSTDIEAEVDHNGHQAEVVADDAFTEIERRAEFTGAGYPFAITGDSIELSVDRFNSSYVFLLLLSWFGPNQDHTPRRHPERSFETLCARAIRSYFGGLTHSKTYRFGWPRSEPHQSFSMALDHVIAELNEGGNAKPITDTRAPRDDQLDIVAWIPFTDKLPGQLIAFGQCAAGSNWEAKVSELPDTAGWCSHRMTDPPLVPPIRTFFVPHCIERGRWEWASRRAGIVFERCRIASCSLTLDGVELQAARDWTQGILERGSQ